MTRTANGKHIYGRAVSLAEALEYFCAEKDIEFDHLYPVYDPPDGQLRYLYKPPWRFPKKYRHFKDRLAFLDAYLGHIRQSWMYT
ncbi:hypothetical protein PI125_g22631 [Phytophthora idaei]|nr:hypothetical protein PI125_g22631 [Phytophthora idaei]